jgi:hypothetical protein
MKLIKHQIGPRVDTATREALERLAAARGVSIGNYAAQALTEHVRRHQGAGVQDFFDEMLQQFDERLAKVADQLRREFESATKRIEKHFTRNIDAVKAMIDASVETREPPRSEEYRQRIAKILQLWGIGPGSNGARHE